MEHRDFLQLLDSYIDGDISDADRLQFLEHAARCPECARELEAAEMLKDVLDGLDDNIAVPLEAQAAWHKAVKAEAAKKNSRKIYRAVYAVAAAFILVFGCTFALRSAPKTSGAINESAVMSAEKNSMEAASSEEFEADMEMMDYSDEAAELSEVPVALAAKPAVLSDSISDTAPAVESNIERKYIVEDVAVAIEQINELAQEYEAKVASAQTTEDGGDVYVQISTSSCEDFLSAISHLGEQTVDITGDIKGDTAMIRITLQAK